jgi:hypothetical protein
MYCDVDNLKAVCSFQAELHRRQCYAYLVMFITPFLRSTMSAKCLLISSCSLILLPVQLTQVLLRPLHTCTTATTAAAAHKQARAQEAERQASEWRSQEQRAREIGVTLKRSLKAAQEKAAAAQSDAADLAAAVSQVKCA